MTEIEQILTELAQQIMLNNLRHLNQSIDDFNNLLSRDPELALKNLSMLSKEDQQTPPAVIEKMIDIAGWRLSDDTLDTTKIYLDPCCGRGGILACLHKHYNIPKENLYGIDIKQENVALCNKLGFNVVKGDALKQETYAKVKDLINQIKGEPMIINRVLMNPPYNGSLHLEVLDATLKAVRSANSSCEIVSVQPVRWLEDPLAECKQGSSYKKYKDTIINKLSKLNVINSDVASKRFNIMSDQDLGIYVFNNNLKMDLNLITPVAKSCIKKILNRTTISMNDIIETDKISGWRVEIHKLLPTATGAHGGDSISAKTNAVKLVNLYSNSVFNNGYDKAGNYWTEDGRAKNGSSKGIGARLPCSIKVDTEIIANNIVESCRTNFYKNIIHMFKYDQNMPLRFLPYMGEAINPLTNLKGYESAWTDEAFCKFFDLTEEESEFMCRKVDDYRVKDFINYINLDEE